MLENFSSENFLLKDLEDIKEGKNHGQEENTPEYDSEETSFEDHSSDKEDREKKSPSQLINERVAKHADDLKGRSSMEEIQINATTVQADPPGNV